MILKVRVSLFQMVYKKLNMLNPTLFFKKKNLFKPQFVVSFTSYSFYPVFSALSGFGLLVSSVYSWHYGFTYWNLFFLIKIILKAAEWWCELIIDKSLGKHSERIKQFRFRMILFILSEVMFFFSFFWGFFNSSFSPSEELGGVWPPSEFSGVVVDGFSIPLLKTCLLVCSGIRLTWFHDQLSMSFFPKTTSFSFILTLIFGGLFLVLQVFEYANSFLSIKRMVYGSCFFLLTGFHGFHVTVGVTFLFYCYYQLFIKKKYSSDFITSFECASWYWHFVDVVWLFLFIFVYVLFS